MLSEKFFYGSTEEDMYVSSARIFLKNKTYAINNITSVETFERKRYRIRLKWLLLPFLISIFLLMDYTIIGLCFYTVSVILLSAYLKKVYVVEIDSASGKSEVLSLTDRNKIMDIVIAINDAIVYAHQKHNKQYRHFN